MEVYIERRLPLKSIFPQVLGIVVCEIVERAYFGFVFIGHVGPGRFALLLAGVNPVV